MTRLIVLVALVVYPVPTVVPTPTPTATPTTTPPLGGPPPVLSRLQARPRTFTARRGTRISLVLDQAATVRVEFRRKRWRRLVRIYELPAGPSTRRLRLLDVDPGRYRLRAVAYASKTPFSVPRTVKVRIRSA